MPLEERVRLFANKEMSRLLQSHSSPDSSTPQHIVNSIHNSEGWYGPTGAFKGDHRGLSFAVCMDGLNPFSREKNSYSTCPIFLVIPISIRMLSGSILLTGLIAGPREPKNTNPYVDVLVNDVLKLNTLTVRDGYKNEDFQLKANMVLNIFDYPGQNKVLHCQGK